MVSCSVYMPRLYNYAVASCSVDAQSCSLLPIM